MQTDKPRVRVPGDRDNMDITAFSFGEPEPVLDSMISDYLGVFASLNDRYYVPPISLPGLSKLLSANGTHESVIHFKKNQLLSLWNDNPLISFEEISAAMLDFMVFENAYFLRIRNGFGGTNRLVRLPAMNMRVGTDNDYWIMNADGSESQYAGDRILHVKSSDVRQNVYGTPSYFGGINSVLLGESATLFRRKYYQNGNHAGYILVTFDLDKQKAKALEDAVSKTKGPGNYRSLYLNMPSTIGGKPGYTKDRVQFIPIGELGNRDEYEKIKSVTMQDILNMHRVPAPLASIMPLNAGGFGDLQNIREVYYDSEISAMQRVWIALNEKIPARGRVSFKEPRWLKPIEP